MDTQTIHYSMIIEWSDEDQAYIVTLPEFHNTHTHGATYEEAVQQGRDLIATWIDLYEQDGKPLPAPKTFDPEASTVN